MISYLYENKRPLSWILFHILLGVGSSFTPYIVIFWFYFVLILGVVELSREKAEARNNVWIGLLVYLGSFELLARMAGTSPYIPYESGKYLIFVLLIFIALFTSNHKKNSIILILLLLPALLYDDSNRVEFKNLIFNLLGPINIALGIYVLKGFRIDGIAFKSLLRFLIYTLSCVLAFSFFKTPDFDKIEFNLGANFDTSGGFGSNQVATILGIGYFLVFIFVINRWKLSGYKWLDILLMSGFVFQGLLTFSRGGILGGLIGIVVFLSIIKFASNIQMKRFQLTQFGSFLLPLIVFGFITFTIVNNLTRGNLLLRYQGETAGTLSGSKEKSFNTLTTDRFNIFTQDLEIWKENLVFGVGAGASRYIRSDIGNDQLSHVELSRLLAEHGILGLLFFLFLVYNGIYVLKSNPNPLFKAIQFALFIIAIYTTFHAATRSFVTPLLVCLSVLTVIDMKPKQKVIL